MTVPRQPELTKGGNSSRTGLESQGTGDDVVSDLAGVHVESGSKTRIALQRSLPAQIGKCANVRQSCVGQGER